MNRITTRRRGVALGAAIFAIVIIGALVAGVFFASTQDFRIARNLLVEQRAFAAAEYGQNMALAAWTPAMLNMSSGDTVRREYDVGGGATATLILTRLNQGTFWAVSEGAAGIGTQLEARRRTGSILRLDIPTVRAMGALTAGLGEVTFSGSATLSGVDENPPGWNCPPPGLPVAGLAVPDTTSTNYTSSSSVPITGSPAILETPQAADSSTYGDFGGLNWNDLTARATFIYTGNASSIAPKITGGGACDTSDPKNWGEPWRPPTAGAVAACADFYPIIWAKPTTFQFSGGRGQGIILVEGDFVASGGTEFKGLILVKGKMTTSGGGIKVHGAMLARNVANAKHTMSGSTRMQYSRCALNTVLSNILQRPTLAPQRAWADMY